MRQTAREEKNKKLKRENLQKLTEKKIYAQDTYIEPTQGHCKDIVLAWGGGLPREPPSPKRWGVSFQKDVLDPTLFLLQFADCFGDLPSFWDLGWPAGQKIFA